MVMQDMVETVRQVNPYRSKANLKRRLVKVLEELGETSEAFLSVSSPHNYKNKSWVDVREESIDTLIVLVDVALTPLTNYPPAALLASNILTATQHSFSNHDALMDQKFAVAAATAQAAQYLQDGNPMAFYGAVNRGIQAAANLCFAAIPEDHNRDEISDRVLTMFNQKIDKWRNSLLIYAAADDGK